MKNDGILKDPSGRMNAQRASWGGGGTSRIHFGPSTKLGMVSLPFDALSFAQGREPVERPNHWRGRETIPRLAKWPEKTFYEVNKITSGFTLIELLIVMSILGLIASFAMPTFFTSMNNSRATTCLLYRQNTQVAADVYIRMNALQVDADMPTIATLVSEGILPGESTCPSGGVYVWNNNKYKGIAQPFFLYCSVHFAAP